MAKYVEIISAEKVHMDSVRIITVGKRYQIHSDERIGDFIIGDKGVHGVIDMKRLDNFQRAPYLWQWRITEG